jgi:hypothetical protein
MGSSFSTDENSLGMCFNIANLQHALIVPSMSQPFLDATLRLSKNKIPLLHEVIPIIDILTDRLEDVSSDAKYLPSVRAGAAKGLAVLNKYYSKTDESVMYRCAMSTYEQV